MPSTHPPSSKSVSGGRPCHAAILYWRPGAAEKIADFDRQRGEALFGSLLVDRGEGTPVLGPALEDGQPFDLPPGARPHDQWNHSQTGRAPGEQGRDFLGGDEG